jgi:hypothetical protein
MRCVLGDTPEQLSLPQGVAQVRPRSKASAKLLG